MEINFTIWGEPTAKGRPRFFVNRGRAMAYTPAQTRSAENNFRAQAIAYKPAEPLSEALQIEIKAFRSIPLSWSKKRQAMAESGQIMPDTRPDADNYAKLVLDAMNGIFWRDDAQIVKLKVEKHYSTKPRIEIVIKEIKEAEK